MLVSTSKSRLSATRPSIFGRSPVSSPTATMWVSTGGKARASRIASAMGRPARTSSSTAWALFRKTRLLADSPAISSASRMGTPP